MAVPTHFKFVFRGVFENTEEEFSFSAKFQRSIAAGPDAELSDIDQAAVTAATAAFYGNGTVGGFSASTLLTEWRAYVQDTTNHMEGNPLLVPLAAPIRGGSPNKFPPQVALCVTTVGDDRGPGRFGRFFLPAPTAPVVDFRITALAAEAYAEAVTQWLKGISAAIDIPGTIDSAEAINVSTLPAPAGSKQNIDHVEVGRVYDTIQSRRRQLLEERHVHGQIDW